MSDPCPFKNTAGECTAPSNISVDPTCIDEHVSYKDCSYYSIATSSTYTCSRQQGAICDISHNACIFGNATTLDRTKCSVLKTIHKCPFSKNSVCLLEVGETPNKPVFCGSPLAYTACVRYKKCIDAQNKLVPEGKKYDAKKARYDLIPAGALAEVADRYTLGAERYGDNNWLNVDNAVNRYYSALLRHLFAWAKGEIYDADDPNLTHLSAVAWNALALVELAKDKNKHDADKG